MGIMQQKRPTKPRPTAPLTTTPPTLAPQKTAVPLTAPIMATPKMVLAAAVPKPKVMLPAAASPPKMTLPSAATPKPEVKPPVMSPPPAAVAAPPKPIEAPSPVLPTSAPQTESTVANDCRDTGAMVETTVTKPVVDHDRALASAAAVTAESALKSNTEGIRATNASDKDDNREGEERITAPPSDRETEGDLGTSAVGNLGLTLSNLTLSDKDHDDLTLQLKELKLKEKADHEDHTEDSGLVSRGPDRIPTKGSRTAPYLLEQHYVSSDRHGGATVLYPGTVQQELGSSQNIPPQAISPPYWQNLRSETRQLTYNNYQNVQESVQKGSFEDLQNILYNPSLPKTPLTEADLKILEDLTNKFLNNPEENQENIVQDTVTVAQYYSQPSPDEGSSDSFDFKTIDQIIRNDRYDKKIQDVKQELSKEHLPPTPPDSTYDSDEGTVGSPPSAVSVGLHRETEKIQPISPSSSSISTQNNIIQQTAYPAASVSPILHTVPPGVVLSLLVQQKPQSPTTVQALSPPTTPSLTPRPILPGVNIPSPCTEPAIKRITSFMTEKVKDAVWAIIFAKPDSDFINEDADQNKALGYMLSNRHKYKNFMEVFHVIVQRLKRIIQGNHDMAHKLLAEPNRCGHTPLDLACRYFQMGEQDALVVRYLADTMVEEGLKIGEELDDCGNTLLHKICNYGDKAQYIMAELLSMKDKRGHSVFDVNRGNNERKTPLHIAALKHSEQTPCTVLAQLLMRSGASAAEQEGCSGNTVFHCVANVSCDPNLLLTLLAMTRDVETVVNKANFNGDTPLHVVAANPTITLERQQLAVRHLIAYKAQPRLTNRSGRVPLSLVAPDRKQDIKTVLYHR